MKHHPVTNRSYSLWTILTQPQSWCKAALAHQKSLWLMSPSVQTFCFFHSNGNCVKCFSRWGGLSRQESETSSPTPRHASSAPLLFSILSFITYPPRSRYLRQLDKPRRSSLSLLIICHKSVSEGEVLIHCALLIHNSGQLKLHRTRLTFRWTVTWQR